MIRNTKRTLVLIVGALFLVLGVVGLVLPFLQGFLFLAVGLIILSVVFPALRERTHEQTRRYPKIHAFVLKVDDWVRRVIGEL